MTLLRTWRSRWRAWRRRQQLRRDGSRIECLRELLKGAKC